LDAVASSKTELEDIVADVKAEVQQAKELVEKIRRDVEEAVRAFVESARERVEDIRAEVEQCVRDKLEA
jgi:methyl-accepting chemotaxis protein